MSKTQIIQKFKKALQKEDINSIGELLRLHPEYNLHMGDEYGEPLILNFFNNLKKINLYKLEELKKFGTNFNVKSNEGEALLNKIIKAENIAAVRQILLPPLALYDEEDDKNYSLELLNIKDNQGNYPLHVAVKTGNIDMIRLLTREFKADPDVINGEGNRPLHYAFEQKRLDLIEVLVEQGANINYKDQKGETLLVKAIGGSLSSVFYNHILVKQMIELGADINVKDKYGESIVNKIVENNDINSLKLIFSTLLQLFYPNSLKLDIINNEGKNWTQIAIENKNSEILKLLLENNVLLPDHWQNLSKDAEINKVLEQYNSALELESATSARDLVSEEQSNSTSEADEEPSSNSDIENIDKEWTVLAAENLTHNDSSLGLEINDANYLERLGKVVNLGNSQIENTDVT